MRAPAAAGTLALVLTATLAASLFVLPLPAAGPFAEEKPKTIDFACPQCDGPLQVPSEMIGKQMTCPHCRRVIAVSMPVEKQPPLQLAPPKFDVKDLKLELSPYPRPWWDNAHVAKALVELIGGAILMCLAGALAAWNWALDRLQSRLMRFWSRRRGGCPSQATAQAPPHTVPCRSDEPRVTGKYRWKVGAGLLFRDPDFHDRAPPHTVPCWQAPPHTVPCRSDEPKQGPVKGPVQQFFKDKYPGKWPGSG
jgi:hypothetical protein